MWLMPQSFGVICVFCRNCFRISDAASVLKTIPFKARCCELAFWLYGVNYKIPVRVEFLTAEAGIKLKSQHIQLIVVENNKK